MIIIGLFLVHVAQNVNLKIDNKGLLLVYICAILPLEVIFLFVIKPGIDIVNMLRTAGYSSYRIAKEGIFGSATMQKFRKRGRPSWEELDKLVKLLHVSPVDLIAYQTDSGEILDITGNRIETPAAPAPQPQPATTAEGADVLQLKLSANTLHNMDGAIRCGYSSDRVQYAIRAINTQIQQDIATEKQRRARPVYPPDDYFDE